MKRLKFPDNSETLHKIISGISDKLGYQFTMSGEALLYFYLQLTIHRIKSGALIVEDSFFESHETFHNLAETVLNSLVERIFSGKLPEGETGLLGLLLQVLEIGDLSTIKISLFQNVINENIKKLTTDMINEFSILDNRLYYLNEHMEAVVNMALASLISRLKYGIPYWHGEWGSTNEELPGKGSKEEILSRLLKDQFNLIAEKKDLQYLLLYFHSLVFNNDDVPGERVRCLVCCFEGIGLASYLQSVLQREIKGINIVEATAVFKIRQEYIDEMGIELIISTFPIRGISTPVILISLPINKDTLKNDISFAIDQLKGQNKGKQQGLNGSTIKAEKDISFNDVLKFIQDFDMFTLSDKSLPEDIISELSEKITLNSEESESLSISFKKREDLGPLYFDEFGIRVLHCKSPTVKNPRAGVIHFGNESKPRVLFMVAPDPCPDSIRKMLSVITISFLENRSFRRAIMNGSQNEIRKNLMDIYKELF
ncbi:MAG: hypothetical protein PF518_17335 [Spirochaetaceae bacterium]|jgi:mannitol operon transcriptional antiterminator|nr:hypothetical protein [Spirochaetaceae bacterium]